jgi:hypothetical protein
VRKGTFVLRKKGWRISPGISMVLALDLAYLRSMITRLEDDSLS